MTLIWKFPTQVPTYRFRITFFEILVFEIKFEITVVIFWHFRCSDFKTKFPSWSPFFEIPVFEVTSYLLPHVFKTILNVYFQIQWTGDVNNHVCNRLSPISSTFLRQQYWRDVPKRRSTWRHAFWRRHPDFSQFHQHFTSSFWANILLTKGQKANL